jgi:microcystin-dependent protein
LILADGALPKYGFIVNATDGVVFGGSAVANGRPPMPVGAMCPWFGSGAVPAGFLECDGSAVSRTTYAGLFGIIGTTYGAGDGSSTFNLPDLRFRAPIGVSAAQGASGQLGAAGGEQLHLLSINEMPLHAHYPGTGSAWSFLTEGGTAYNVSWGGTATFQVAASNQTGTQGGNAAHNNMPPYLVIRFLIAY